MARIVGLNNLVPWCQEHNAEFKQFTRGNQWCYWHQLPDRSQCRTESLPLHELLIGQRAGRANTSLVIFVHGLQGHILQTWGNFPQLLAQDEDLKQYDIGFFGYPTSILDKGVLLFSLPKWLPRVRRYSFPSKAMELGDELMATLTQRGYQLVVLVGHSLGGLMILGALRHLEERGDSNRLEAIRRISSVVFCGTPILGSDRVTWFTALLSTDLRALLHSHEYRSSLVQWVEDRLVGHLVRLYDTYADIGIMYSATDRWVSIESAIARLPRGMVEQWSVSHTQLCKPQDQQSRPYGFLKNFLCNARPQLSVAEIIPRHLRLESNDEFRWVISPDDPDLTEARPIYEKRMPDRREQDKWEDFLRWIRESAKARESGEERDYEEYLCILKVRGHVAAMLHMQYQFEQRHAWVGYLVGATGVAQNVAARLAVQAMEQLRDDQRNCRGVIFEVEKIDAPGISGEDREYRKKRIHYFQKKFPAVYWVSGLDYRQPGLDPERARTDQEVPMYLMYVPVPPGDRLKWLTKGQVIQMLQTIAQVQGPAFEDHPRFLEYQEYLQKWVDRLANSLLLSVQVDKIGELKV